MVENLCGDNGKSKVNGAGIVVRGPGNRITDNDVTANQNGIRIEGEGGNWIAENTVVDSQVFGIESTNSMDNIVVRNAVGTWSTRPEHRDYQIPNSQFGAIRGHSTGSITNSNPWQNFKIRNGP